MQEKGLFVSPPWIPQQGSLQAAGANWAHLEPWDLFTEIAKGKAGYPEHAHLPDWTGKNTWTSWKLDNCPKHGGVHCWIQKPSHSILSPVGCDPIWITPNCPWQAMSCSQFSPASTQFHQDINNVRFGNAHFCSNGWNRIALNIYPATSWEHALLSTDWHVIKQRKESHNV